MLVAAGGSRPTDTVGNNHPDHHVGGYEMHREVGETLIGQASYYGTDADGFIGRTMSNG
jgi:hypothetical protein